MWQVEYQQCPRGHTWEFRFDHVPLDDGRWHAVSRSLDGVYRVEHEGIQYCVPMTDVPPDEWRFLLEELRIAGPWITPDQVEVIIQRREDGFWMRAPRATDHDEVRIASLTCPDLTSAYRALRRRMPRK